MIKQGEGASQWRFERAEGKRYVSAGTLVCSDLDAKAMVESLAAKHGSARAGNGVVEFTVNRASFARKVQL